MNITGNYPQSVAKRHLNIRLGKMLQPAARNDGDELLPYLRAANVTWGAVDHSDTKEMWFSPEDREKYGVSNGDLLVLEGGDVGRAAIASHVGHFLGIQNSLHRVRPKKGNEIRFAYYWMQHLSAFGYFDLVCSKATLAHFTSEKFAAAPYPQIDGADQKRIADFLDRETALIDQLIEKKQRLIKVYGEREEAGFHQAITGKSIEGPTSDSGVDWIGDMPSHWVAPKFVHVAKQETGHTPSRKEDAYWVPEECTIPWVSLADVWQLRDGSAVYIKDTSEKISPLGMANSAARLLPAQTVILSRTASVGFAGILAVPMATTQDFVGWICSSKIRPKYMYFVLRAMKSVFRRLMMGSTHQTIYMPDIRSFRLPLPPIREQDAIIAELEQAVGTFRATAAKLQTSVDKLREFRSALITAAVTGQIDVTTWGKQGQTDRRLDKIQEEMGS